MPLTYSNNAQARMVDGAIYRKQVRRTLRRPDSLYSQGQNQVAEYATSKGVIVRVVYHATLEGSCHVITAVRLGKLKCASQNAPIETVYDRAFDVAYVGLLSGRIAETIEVSSGVYYGLDSYGEIRGVEVLDYSRYRNDDGTSLRGVLAQRPKRYIPGSC